MSASQSRELALAQLLGAPELGRAYLIYAEDEAVGYALLCFGFSLEFGGRDAFLDEFYVLPAARGNGIGRQALCLLEAKAAANGARALHLEVLAASPRSAALYRRAGFEDRDSRLLSKKLIGGAPTGA